MSFMSSPLSLVEEESIYISLSLPFIQDSLTAIAQLYACVFGSCFLMFLPPTPIGSLHALFPFPNTEGAQHFPFPVLHPNSRQLPISVPIQEDQPPSVSLPTSSLHPPPLS